MAKVSLIMDRGKEDQRKSYPSAHIAEKVLVNGFRNSVNPNTAGAKLLLPSVKSQVLVLCHF